MNFGYRLKELRLSKNLTQQDLGNIIHVSKVSISGYERGERSPDTETLTAIADYFKVSTDYLLGRENNKLESGKSTKVDTIAAHIDDDITDQQMGEILNFIAFVTNRNHTK
ncbi:helix-turn-helix domain-containing protein [Enterococcus sp. DIV0876]|uniref:helix-turn-helix domain-containing protein n=1 Tax=Enterococcus sp. DIV0876 TaxID=2774633 RepID=UPI003D301603